MVIILSGIQTLHETRGDSYFSDVSMRKLVHILHDHTEPARPELLLTA